MFPRWCISNMFILSEDEFSSADMTEWATCKLILFIYTLTVYHIVLQRHGTVILKTPIFYKSAHGLRSFWVIQDYFLIILLCQKCLQISLIVEHTNGSSTTGTEGESYTAVWLSYLWAYMFKLSNANRHPAWTVTLFYLQWKFVFLINTV